MKTPRSLFLLVAIISPAAFLFSSGCSKKDNTTSIAQDTKAAVKDAAAERSYYVGKLGFEAMGAGESGALRIPGDSRQQVQLEPADAKAALSFGVADVARTAEELRQRGLAVTSTAGGVAVTDPDGVSLIFVAGK